MSESKKKSGCGCLGGVFLVLFILGVIIFKGDKEGQRTTTKKRGSSKSRLFEAGADLGAEFLDKSDTLAPIVDGIRDTGHALYEDGKGWVDSLEE